MKASTALFYALALLVLGSSARAQWQTQDITLQPGWNAVYLEVQPEPARCDVVFQGLPVESVWMWNSHFSSVQFLQDPDKLVPKQPDWLAYSTTDAGGRSLHTLRAGDAYLIKLAGASAVTWRVKGQPQLRAKLWRANSYNFAGFAIDPTRAPFFANYFQSSPAHRDQPIYRLSAAGKWERLANPAASTIRRGEAFWVYTKGDSAFNGPLEVSAETGESLHFGRLLTESTVRLKNNSASTVTVTLSPGVSETPSDNSSPALAGVVPLSYWKMDLANGVYAWNQFPSPLTLSLGAGAQRSIRVALRRQDMAPFTPGVGVSEYLYQSLINVTDGTGSRVSIPVNAQGSAGSLARNVAKKGIASVTTSTFAGLWIGSVELNGVSQPASIAEPNVPKASDSALSFRILVHVDASGAVRLLQQALFMWKPGAVNGEGEVETPGRFVIVTDDAKIPLFEGATQRDGKSVGRRISTVAYALPAPKLMTGTFAIGQSLSCNLALGYDDPLNPFKHRYHPDHNNLDARYETILPAGRESFDINRNVTLTLSAQDPQGLSLAGWGDDQMGGDYLETVTGIHKQPIFLKGVARLRRVSPVAILNDGQP